MNFLLLTLLVISLSVTAAGFLLSNRESFSRTFSRKQEIAYYSERRAYRGYQIVTPQRTARLPFEFRQRSNVTNLLLPGIRQFFRWRADEEVPWKIITVGLISIFVLGLYAFNLLLPRPALWNIVSFYTNPTSASASSSNQAPPPPQLYGASKALVRLGQLDPAQYTTSQEYDTWAYSTCSTASMTEVINAYGHHYRITDILQVEARLGEITPAMGLLEDVGIARTVAQFGFNTDWGHNPSLDRIITIANSGTPVIVSFPPDRYPGGHLLVLTGGNSSYVYLADSSRINRHVMTHAEFTKWWEGFYAVVTPK